MKQLRISAGLCCVCLFAFGCQEPGPTFQVVDANSGLPLEAVMVKELDNEYITTVFLGMGWRQHMLDLGHTSGSAIVVTPPRLSDHVYEFEFSRPGYLYTTVTIAGDGLQIWAGCSDHYVREPYGAGRWMIPRLSADEPRQEVSMYVPKQFIRIRMYPGSPTTKPSQE